ncbi:PTS system, Lactose/Cellobiose specific IIB subunit [Anaerococcus lactolyticus ATCC 51172]|uniref:PTS system, Lactose/Cellobiose specific IIB subunit n=1 Tax=Anaerococcus lactolyticus ATCC 51172 TaxID=525254 RepID=C2BGE4_9FIRM|nr:PTS sugar transporter subunit IIB [Anaerococcus lactolyticus]EEI86071.1 PTS system, Lactose/Cellobiose specific IIB subunit [Anaerococcus lactolyticus ATCC 51172]
MSKKIKVLVACGSGIVTSTIVQEEIKRIAIENNIDIDIKKSTISEVESKQNEFDVIFTTSNYRNKLETPHLSVFGLVSGINKDKNIEDIIKILKQLSN